MATLAAFHSGVGPSGCSSERRMSMSFLRSLVNSSGSDLDAGREAADAGLVGRQQPLDELLGARRDEAEALLHAAAAVEHHDHGDGLRLGGKERDRLKLAVVVDLEVVFGEVGHQPAGRVGDGGVDRDRARAALEGRLLLAGNRRTQCRDDTCRRHEISRSEGGASERAHLGAHREYLYNRNGPRRSQRSAGLGQGRHPLSHHGAERPGADPDGTRIRSSTGRGSRGFRRDADLADPHGRGSRGSHGHQDRRRPG